MTYEELNVVRNLKKKLEAEKQKLSALRESITPATPKLNDAPHGTNTASPTEKLATMITDTERKIANLNIRIEIESFKLTNKIQAEVPNETEQALLIHRYINCKHFRDIGFLMGFSEAHVYFTHRKILKTILQENLIVNNSR